MSEPDLQRITLVGIQGQPEDVDCRVEAFEVQSGPGEAAPVSEAIDSALAVVAPRYYVLRESLNQSNWGATGLQVQDILILYGIAAAGQITASAFVAAIGREARALTSNKIDSADGAWEIFSDFMLRSFEISGATLVEATNEGGTWKLLARARGREFEGTVSSDGRVIEARRRDTK